MMPLHPSASASDALTNEDEDDDILSSSNEVTDEPHEYTLSPNQLSRVKFRNWIKGDYLGTGSLCISESGNNGLQPTILNAPPPAMMPLLIADDMESNWDLIRSFAPTDEGSSSVAVDAEYPLSTNGLFRGGFKNWQKGDFLGRGSFDIVYEGFNEMGYFFAVKEVSLIDQGSQRINLLEQEISLLTQLHHENIVQYLGTDRDDDKLYIFLELVTKGSLARLYQKNELKDSQVSAYTRQILNGLNYLHERKVLHRDIKCANILIDASGSVKLADFGLAKETTWNDTKSLKGAIYLMAPEVVNDRLNTGYGLAADIWSLGCTVLEMLTRKVPYSHLEGMRALFTIGKGQLSEIPDTLSTEAQDFILKCLRVNPDSRPTTAELLDHPFVSGSTSMNLGVSFRNDSGNVSTLS